MRITRHQPGSGGDFPMPEMFVGHVSRQEIVTDDDAKLLRVTSVTFHDGSRNVLHHHGSDQVLVITHGLGIVANEQGENLVEGGDIVLVPAGERHWHGARPGETMTHLSILTPGPMFKDE